MFEPARSGPDAAHRALAMLAALPLALAANAGLIALAAANQLIVKPLPLPVALISPDLPPPPPRPARAERPWPDARRLAAQPRPLPPAPPPPAKPRRPPRPPLQEMPVVIGGNVVPPELVHGPQPRCPSSARRARLSGVVILEVVVDRDGRVADSRVLREPGLGTGEAALTVVDSWRFRPATLDGRPVAVFLTVTVRFQC